MSNVETSPASSDGTPIIAQSAVARELIANFENTASEGQQIFTGNTRVGIERKHFSNDSSRAAYEKFTRPQTAVQHQPMMIATGQAMPLSVDAAGVVISDVTPVACRPSFQTIEVSEREGVKSIKLSLSALYLSEQLPTLLEFLKDNLSERSQGEFARSFAALCFPVVVNGHVMALTGVDSIHENNTNKTVCGFVPSTNGQKVSISGMSFYDIHFGNFTASFSQEAIDELSKLVLVS